MSNEEIQDELNQQEKQTAGHETDNLSETNWQDKYQETYDTYLRLFSEFDNYRKRTLKERSELIKSAGSDIMSGLIPVLDDFDRALKSMDTAQDLESVKQGVQLIFHKLKSTLTEKGLAEIAALHEDFNPDIHEAITHIPAGDETQKGKVVDVLEKGYKIGEKIIRFPKVVVGN